MKSEYLNSVSLRICEVRASVTPRNAEFSVQKRLREVFLLLQVFSLFIFRTQNDMAASRKLFIFVVEFKAIYFQLLSKKVKCLWR
jgi:hypothetical protein